MHGTGAGHHMHIRLERLAQLNGHPQMAVVDRVKGTAKDCDQKTALRICKPIPGSGHRSATDLAITQYHELLGGQPFQADWTTSVDLVSGNADLSP